MTTKEYEAFTFVCEAERAYLDLMRLSYRRARAAGQRAEAKVFRPVTNSVTDFINEVPF